MLVNLVSMLGEAQKGNFAIGSFNIYSYETIRGVMNAAVELDKPAIVAFGANYLKNMDLESVHDIVVNLSKSCSNPVALHLDHCKSIDTIREALAAGFTSIMYDGSALPYEENVKNTAEVVRMAHAAGASVEAELGSIKAGQDTNEEDAAEIYTDPAVARDFVERTGVDCLAVSIGTVHGLYKGTPRISIDTLKAIKKEVSVPLVLHGGSGTPEATIRECIENGICKINVNTEISVYTVDMLAAKLSAEGKKPHLSQLCLAEVEAVSEVVKKYMRFFANEA